LNFKQNSLTLPPVPYSLWILPCIVFFLATGCAEKQYYNTALPPAKLIAQCHALSQKKKYDKANNCYEALKSRHPGSREAIEANLYIADNQFRQREYLVAAETYRNFIKLHPVHSRLDYAYYKTGLSYLKETPEAIDRDQQYLDDAIRYFEIVLKYYPHSQYAEINKEKWEQARLQVASRMYYIGRFYYRRGEYIASIPRFEDIYQNYPAIGVDEKALYYLGLSQIKLSRKMEALETYNILSGRFPEGDYSKRLASKLGIK
jgi:outer membrane protein assembly factor BamD